MDARHHDSWTMWRCWLIVATATALAACASTSSTAPSRPTTEGTASYRSVAKDDLEHYKLALGQVASGAIPHDQPPPIYPAALLDQRLPPHDVAARVIVDEAGKAVEVRIDGEAQADPATRLFDQAVRTAAMQWTYEPLHVSQWAADADGNSHEVSREERPFSMDYVFHFAWKDGKPAVDASASTRNAR
jgi:hypothetical protein